MLSSSGVTWSDTLKSLRAFFVWLSSSKEFWAGIMVAVVSGLMTLIAAILVQEQAAKKQRQRDLETERRRIKNLLQAIRAELTVLKTDHLDLLQTKLKERAERQKSGFSQSPLAMPPTKQNHFVVFESNGAALGRSEEHTSELQSHLNLVCRLLLEKKKKSNIHGKYGSGYDSIQDLQTASHRLYLPHLTHR